MRIRGGGPNQRIVRPSNPKLEGTAAVNLDLKFFRDEFSPWDQRHVDQIESIAPVLQAQCPITRSSAHDGYWMVYSYAETTAVFQNWQAFSNVNEKSIAPVRSTQPVQPPISLDPPLHRMYRQLLNPFLTPRSVAKFDHDVRELVDDLIDKFIEAGECDLAAEFSREFPGRMLYKCLFNIDPDEVPQVLGWTRKVAQAPSAPDTPEAELNWISWIYELIESRRRMPRSADILDAVLYAKIDGKNITDEEAMGVIYILIFGGFGTTADAISNSMYRLACDQELQARLRAHPDLIPSAIEEFLRYDPPVGMQPRFCVADTEIGGRLIRKGDRIAVSLVAANRDAAEFSRPEVLDIDRDRNRHLAFGVGVHRCIGSNLARLNLRTSLEQLLVRLGRFELKEKHAAPVRHAAFAWGIESLPLVFEGRTGVH